MLRVTERAEKRRVKSRQHNDKQEMLRVAERAEWRRVKSRHHNAKQEMLRDTEEDGGTETTTCPSLFMGECENSTIPPHDLRSMNFKCICCEALHFEVKQTGDNKASIHQLL